MTSYWMPVALLGLHAYRRSATSAGGWCCLASRGSCRRCRTATTCCFFRSCSGCGCCGSPLSRATVARVSATSSPRGSIASLPLIPLLWSYRRIHSAFSFQRDLGEVNGFGADVTSLLDASPLLKFWTLRSFHQPEGELFPGFTAALLVLLLVIHVCWRSERVMRVPRVAMLLLAAARPCSSRIGLSSLLSGRLGDRHRQDHAGVGPRRQQAAVDRRDAAGGGAGAHPPLPRRLATALPVDVLRARHGPDVPAVLRPAAALPRCAVHGSRPVQPVDAAARVRFDPRAGAVRDAGGAVPVGRGGALVRATDIPDEPHAAG